MRKNNILQETINLIVQRPIVFYPGGQDDNVPDGLIAKIKQERLENFRNYPAVIKEEASDSEIITYLFTKCLSTSVDNYTVELFAHLLRKVVSKYLGKAISISADTGYGRILSPGTQQLYKKIKKDIFHLVKKRIDKDIKYVAKSLGGGKKNMNEIIQKIDMNSLGPIQCKRVKNVLKKYTYLRSCRREISNRLENGQIIESECICMSTSFQQDPKFFELLKNRLDQILSAISYSVTPLNYQRITEQIAEATTDIKKNYLPIDDKRKTLEILKADEKWWADNRAKEEEQDKKNNVLKARWPYPKLIVLEETFYTMGGDYGNTNIANTWILANGTFAIRNMNDFRNAIAKCPSLKSLSWKPRRSIGAHVYKYEIGAEPGKTVYCYSDKKRCNDEYVRGNCPGHKTEYVVKYSYVSLDGTASVWPELDEKQLIGSVQQTSKIEDKIRQTQEIEFVHNEAQDGLEVKFPAPATAEQISILKKNGFRWARFRKNWYTKGYTPEKETSIKQALGISAQ